MSIKKIHWKKVALGEWEGELPDRTVIVKISQFNEDVFSTDWQTKGSSMLHAGDYISLNSAKRNAQGIWDKFVYSLI